MDPKRATIHHADSAMNPETKKLTYFVTTLEATEAKRIKKMLDDGIIVSDTVFRCQIVTTNGNIEEQYVNMLHVSKVKFEY